MSTPTWKIYDGLDQAYAYFNKRLFGARLPECAITVRPHRGAYGYFSPEVFASRDNRREIRDEIALNIRHFKSRSAAQTYSTLVHEMVHLEQQHFGHPSRNGYHNRQWAEWMQRIGLHPSDTGAVGGKRTGQRVTHYIVAGGPFDQAFKARRFTVPYYDRQEETETTRKKLKLTYVCANCDARVTGKPDLLVHCGQRSCHMAPMRPRTPLPAVA